jgi:hypothetical protein
LFVDTNVPSTGIYRDTGTAWVAIAGSAAEVQDLNSVCTVGNTTTTLGIVIAGDSAIGTLTFEGYALNVGESDAGPGKSINTEYDCTINGINIGRGNANQETNTSLGKNALDANSNSGIENTACGYQALQLNNDGSGNTALGYYAARETSEGIDNTAVGRNALTKNTNGSNNVAIGVEALDEVTEGNNNIGIGHNAGNVIDGIRNIFIGVNTALTTTSDKENVVIGHNALAPSGDNQFVVGSAAHNAGTVASEVNASSRVWNVVINGVARKILLA